MNLSNKPQQNPDYRLEMIDNELLLFHPNKTTIIYFNQTASLVWQLCDGQRTVSEIIDLLKTAYPQTKNIRADIDHTLQQFIQHGAVEVLNQ